MSDRFAEREHRRAKGLPPLDSVDEQIEALDEQIADALRSLRAVSRDLRSARAAIGELRRDVQAGKKPAKGGR